MHSEIYGHAELYDIALGFKDVPAECDVLVELARRFGGREPLSFLELAAGPATHAREMAKRRLRSTAIDLSPGMVAYARSRAADEGLDMEVIEADMTDFTIAEPVDVATILMDSLGVLLDNDAVIRHLDCVADALKEGGVYVLEMGHPRDVFKVGKSAENDWEMERDGIRVHTTWGLDTDPFDPTTQIIENTVTFTWEREGEQGEITEILPDRSITPNEMRAVVAASGRFEVVAELGAMNLDVPFGNTKESWRYVPVLRRIN
jgi:SAM-dependent methyltransferase